MSRDRIKVVGYAQKTFYNDQIEYRNFSPDLVGVQLASNGGTPLFTMGNFAVTTNFDPKIDKRFVTNRFSNFVTLTDLDLTLQSALNLLRNNDGVFLNLDKSNLMYYSLFGSLKEFTRVALENIISNWPAALYVNPIYALEPLFITQSGNTFENYVYDALTDEATFRVNTNVITNRFGINFINISVDAQENTPKNLNINYQSYVIFIDGVEYSVLGFTGATSAINDYLYFKVKGDVFSGASSGYSVYYIKPNSIKENLFYNSLPDFELYLLNRYSSPKFTSTFSFTEKSDAGDIVYVKETLTWPVSDGYNIDFDTEDYDTFATRLLEITTNYDLSTSNLMVRFLVTESITDFDTTAVHLNPQDQDSSDQKMNKTLTIYGAEYDEINRYIVGIQYANVVSYDKVNNMPDIYIKNLARVLGWELVSSVLENNLLKNYTQPSNSTYDGYSVGLTPVEADIELWRRLILNSPWIWKSKGTRKGIEFLFKFIGTPLGLIKFNEYIYLAENKVDTDLLQSVLALNGLPTDISTYPIGDDGYPLPRPNTPTMYFQNKGLWYRQTGGEESTIDITTGNNPHVGPYDGGYQYMNQFRELIPNFSAVTVTSSTSTITTTNLFTNYNFGSFTQYSGDTYVDITTDDGVDFSNCFVVSATTIEDPKRRQDQTDCGCDIPENLRSLSICLEKKAPTPYDCEDAIANYSTDDVYGYNIYNFYQYLPDGSVYTINGNPVYHTSNFVDVECCSTSGMIPYYYEEYVGNGTPTTPFTFLNSGYICCNSKKNLCGCYTTCKWTLATPRRVVVNGANYLQFKKEDGTTVLTAQDGCHCIAGYSIPVQLSASTTDVGYACQLTESGIADIDSTNSIIYETYQKRSIGEINCTEVYTPPVGVNRIYVVVINNGTHLNQRLNSFGFVDLDNSNIGGDFANVNVPLSATPNSLLSAGYYYSYQPTTSPLPNDRIRIETPKNLMVAQNATLAFNPAFGHKMYYMASDVQYDNITFMSNVFSGLTQVPVSQTILYGQDYYTGQFTYTPVGNQSNLYLIIDVSDQIIRSNSGGTGNAVVCPYLIRTFTTDLGYNETGCVDVKHQVYLADGNGRPIPNPLSVPILVSCRAEYSIGDCGTPIRYEARTGVLSIDPGQTYSTNFFAATNPNEYVRDFELLSVNQTTINNCPVEIEVLRFP